MDFKTLNKSFVDFLRDFQNRSIDELKDEYDLLKILDSDKKTALDNAYREVLLELKQNDVKVITQFIGFSIESCRRDLCSSIVPVVLLGDLFDLMTLDQCEILFNYVEENVNAWKEECFFASCKNNILRMCNDLLRRLSRSQNTVFCGRILLFLAKFFPFSERSGLNIISEFNLDNVTEYGAESSEMSDELAATSSSIKPEEGLDNQLQINYNLYCKFWSLQDFFRNPNQCYNKVQWKIFASHAANVLSAFNSFKLEEQRERKNVNNYVPNDSPQEMDTTNCIEENNEKRHFFAKFLTNPKLLSLQLSDSNFRRSVLIQFLILFQYLNSTVKFKMDNYNLTDAQSEWLKDNEELVYKLLKETPPNGKFFATCVKHSLEREELWSNWKNDGCKEFKRPHDNSEDEFVATPPKKTAHLGDLIKEATSQGKHYLGNPDLTKIWNFCPNNLAACKGADRNFLPILEQFIENPKEKIQPSYEWRALRLLARTSPHFFTLFNGPSSKLSDYLDSIGKKIQKEKVDEQLVAKESTVEQEALAEPETESFNEEAVQIETDQMTPPDDVNDHPKPQSLTQEQIDNLSAIILADWKKLGSKLGYIPHDIACFERENPNPEERCRAMLTFWFQDDEDASLENLLYYLEGMKINKAVEEIKKYVVLPADKTEIIVSE